MSKKVNPIDRLYYKYYNWVLCCYTAFKNKQQFPEVNCKNNHKLIINLLFIDL